jgi:hypothetical protein
MVRNIDNLGLGLGFGNVFALAEEGFDPGIFEAGIFEAGVLEAGSLEAGSLEAGTLETGTLVAPVCQQQLTNLAYYKIAYLPYL